MSRWPEKSQTRSPARFLGLSMKPLAYVSSVTSTSSPTSISSGARMHDVCATIALDWAHQNGPPATAPTASTSLLQTMWCWTAMNAPAETPDTVCGSRSIARAHKFAEKFFAIMQVSASATR